MQRQAWWRVLRLSEVMQRCSKESSCRVRRCSDGGVRGGGLCVWHAACGARPSERLPELELSGPCEAVTLGAGYWATAHD